MPLFKRSPYPNVLLKHLTNKPNPQQAKLLVELKTNTDRLTRHDIASWRSAWQRAIDAQNPNRNALYDIYNDTVIDLHLSGCIDQRTGFTMRKPFKFVDADGAENADAYALFEQPWFDNFMRLALDARFWGTTLIELGPVISTGTAMHFQYVQLVPRKHVRPERGVIVREQSDEASKGIPYRDGPLSDWVVEIGQPNDLGLLLKCAPAALSKKNMLAFWDGFGEIFGMPIRLARTSSRDERERSKIENMLANMGAAFYGVFPESTEIEIKETTRGDAYNVYDRRIDRANSELSKAILNQTMTIDNGSSHAQGEVHLEVFQNVVEQDARMLRNIINAQLLPLMLRHGFPVEGLSFEWDNPVVFNTEQVQRVEQMLLTAGYVIPADYFRTKYGIECADAPLPTNLAQLSNPNLAFDDFFA